MTPTRVKQLELAEAHKRLQREIEEYLKGRDDKAQPCRGGKK